VGTVCRIFGGMFALFFIVFMGMAVWFKSQMATYTSNMSTLQDQCSTSALIAVVAVVAAAVLLAFGALADDF